MYILEQRSSWDKNKHCRLYGTTPLLRLEKLTMCTDQSVFDVVVGGGSLSNV